MNTFCFVSSYFGYKYCENISAPALESAFQEHIANFGLTYGTTEEYNFRLDLFIEKDQIISELNANPEHTFTVGHNQFSTWTDAEYKKLLGAKVNTEAKDVEVLDTANLTDSVDWRTKGAVNAVKNQGQCGSCWAFSATSAIEGHHFIATGNLLSFAEQEIVDCDTTSYGCNGGW